MELNKKIYYLIIISISLFCLAGIFYFVRTTARKNTIAITNKKIINFLPINKNKEKDKAKIITKIPQENYASIVAVGDIMLSRTVDSKMREQDDYYYPFAKTDVWLQDADITFGNLETAITIGRAVQPMETNFRSDPQVARAMKEAGFDILSLANNHTPNFGETGLSDTFAYLDQAGIIYVGAGKNINEARETVFITAGNIKFAWLSYNDSDVVPADYGAGANRAGTNLMDEKKLKSDIEKIKSESDFIILSMHSGTEYIFTPNDRQIAFAHAAIDTGADLVIGHHPHVVQSAEIYKGKYIFYSLGNFIFDQMWSEPTREGLMLKFFIINNEVSKIIAQPVLIENYSQPKIITNERADKIIDRLRLEFEKNERGEYALKVRN